MTKSDIHVSRHRHAIAAHLLLFSASLKVKLSTLRRKQLRRTLNSNRSRLRSMLNGQYDRRFIGDHRDALALRGWAYKKTPSQKYPEYYYTISMAFYAHRVVWLGGSNFTNKQSDHETIRRAGRISARQAWKQLTSRVKRVLSSDEIALIFARAGVDADYDAGDR